MEQQMKIAIKNNTVLERMFLCQKNRLNEEL